MAQRVDTVTQHVFAFDDDEITVILNALYDAGESELADEIFDEMGGECDDCECSESRIDVSSVMDALNKCEAMGIKFNRSGV